MANVDGTEIVAASVAMKPRGYGWAAPGPDLLSVLLGLSLTVAASVLLWGKPEWIPKEGGVTYTYFAPWYAILYLAPQIALLIQSVRKVQHISLLDLGASAGPVFVGGLALLNKAQGTLPLSGPLTNLVSVMIVTCILDTALTIAMKFALQGRNITTPGGS